MFCNCFFLINVGIKVLSNLKHDFMTQRNDSFVTISKIILSFPFGSQTRKVCHAIPLLRFPYFFVTWIFLQMIKTNSISKKHSLTKLEVSVV